MNRQIKTHILQTVLGRIKDPEAPILMSFQDLKELIMETLEMVEAYFERKIV